MIFFSDLRRWSSWNSLVVLMNKKIYSFFLLLYLRRLLCLGPEWSDERVQRLFGQNRKEEGAAADEKSRKIIGNYRNNRNNGKSLWVDFLLSSPAKAPAIASASASHGKRKEEREILNFVMFLIFFFISNIFSIFIAPIWFDEMCSPPSFRSFINSVLLTAGRSLMFFTVNCSFQRGGLHEQYRTCCSSSSPLWPAFNRAHSASTHWAMAKIKMSERESPLEDQKNLTNFDWIWQASLKYRTLI